MIHRQDGWIRGAFFLGGFGSHKRAFRNEQPRTLARLGVIVSSDQIPCRIDPAWQSF